MDNTIKLIAYALAALIAMYVLTTILPYIVMFLALCGAYHLWQEYHKPKR